MGEHMPAVRNRRLTSADLRTIPNPRRGIGYDQTTKTASSMRTLVLCYCQTHATERQAVRIHRYC